MSVYFRMLDEFGAELETTDSRMDTTMKKVAKVLHMSNGMCELTLFTSSLKFLFQIVVSGQL